LFRSSAPIVLGSAEIQLQHYFSDTTSAKELSLILLNNGRPCGALVKATIIFDDLIEGVDDNSSDISDNVSVTSETTDSRQNTSTPGDQS
jgi:hypothetical protein